MPVLAQQAELELDLQVAEGSVVLAVLVVLVVLAKVAEVAEVLQEFVQEHLFEEELMVP